MLRVLGCRLATAIVATCALGGAAMAHPGAHDHLSFSELVAHLGSGWHLSAMVAAAVVGALVFAIMLGHRRRAGAARISRNRRDRS